MNKFDIVLIKDMALNSRFYYEGDKRKRIFQKMAADIKIGKKICHSKVLNMENLKEVHYLNAEEKGVFLRINNY
jgi:hypothetical protein